MNTAQVTIVAILVGISVSYWKILQWHRKFIKKKVKNTPKLILSIIILKFLLVLPWIILAIVLYFLVK